MKYIILIMLFLGSQFVAASDDHKKITAEKGIVINVKKFRSDRSLPHAYYDQAVSSIPKLYPDHIFYAKRRYGQLGKIQYSIVCYKETKNISKVLITGVAVSINDAWSFETYVSESDFADKLLIVLEAIEKFPSNKSLNAVTLTRDR